MEIQIPLVLFVAFCALSSGIFASQAVLALKGEDSEAQMPSLIAAFVALVVGGVAVLFHLAQPLHIFNGFGNPTSGITQELVVIVLMVIVMLVYFAMLRRNDGKVPAWCAVAAIVVAVVLDIVCGHSYMMPSRPAWDSILQPLSLIGGSCAAGPALVAAIAVSKKPDAESNISGLALAGAVVGLATTAIYIAALAGLGSSFVDMGTYLDPTNPTAPVFSGADVSPFSGTVLPATCTAIVASIVAVVTAYAGKKTGNWKVWGALTVIVAFVAMIALRIVFYQLGASVFNFYGITG